MSFYSFDKVEIDHIYVKKTDPYSQGFVILPSSNMISLTSEIHSKTYDLIKNKQMKSSSKSGSQSYGYAEINVFNEYVKHDLENTTRVKSFNSNLFPQYKINNTTSSFLDHKKEKEENDIRDSFSTKLYFYIENDDIGIGTYTEADKMLEMYLSKYNDLIQNMLSFIFKKNIGNVDFLCRLLLLISRINPVHINKTGHTIAMAALNHRSDDVKESALRLFESFGDQDTLAFLKSSKPDAYWLQEYKEQIINDIENGYLS